MSAFAIRAELVSKQYRLGTINHGLLARDLQSWWSRLRGKEDPNRTVTLRLEERAPAAGDFFWALKDVSFEVQPGEILGIIGRNGAGKSTLLKILSRVTAPTGGEIRVNGRVASLLEVGTGFHPELTGRENVFLNGAILGMTRQEIVRKFDEIVAFSEIEPFIDTPVKRYSSGMYVRLAFAVAAHLEPEILVVDEVLAVGDAQFQQKCLGKMEEVSKRQGRTILFVSHNMTAIAALCSKGLLLVRGEVASLGDIQQTVSLYNGSALIQHRSLESCTNRAGTGGIRTQRLWLTNASGGVTNEVGAAESVALHLEARVLPEYQNKNIAVGFAIDALDGTRLFTAVSSWKGQKIPTRGEGLTVHCALPALPLVAGRYLVSTSIIDQGDGLDTVVHGLSFNVKPDGFSHLRYTGPNFGHMDIPYSFSHTHV